MNQRVIPTTIAVHGLCCCSIICGFRDSFKLVPWCSVPRDSMELEHPTTNVWQELRSSKPRPHGKKRSLFT